MRGSGRGYPDEALQEALRGLAGIRGVEGVGFEGDLPVDWTGPLKGVMEGDGEGVEVEGVEA